MCSDRLRLTRRMWTYILNGGLRSGCKFTKIPVIHNPFFFHKLQAYHSSKQTNLRRTGIDHALKGFCFLAFAIASFGCAVTAKAAGFYLVDNKFCKRLSRSYQTAHCTPQSIIVQKSKGCSKCAFFSACSGLDQLLGKGLASSWSCWGLGARLPGLCSMTSLAASHRCSFKRGSRALNI